MINTGKSLKLQSSFFDVRLSVRREVATFTQSCRFSRVCVLSVNWTIALIEVPCLGLLPLLQTLQLLSRPALGVPNGNADGLPSLLTRRCDNLFPGNLL